MEDHLLSLAAGVCPETGPTDFVTACATAGWEACGIWFDPETWTDAVATDVRRRLDDTGVIALDMEPVFVTADGDHGVRMVEAAAAVGARNLLVVSRGVDDERFTTRFGELCDLAAPHGIGCSIEFLAFMSVSSLPQSLAVLDAVDRPNGGVLIDALHLARTGGSPDEVAEIAAVAPERLAYAQLCDGPAEAPDDAYADALDGRMNVGDGGLPVHALVDAFPSHTAFSMEIRSAHLRRAFTDPTERARHVLDATTAWFDDQA
ncbi:sugar phosphate isomerase/epimerase family protein [Ilumatobacter sp.]|uniref:sugar phosphate isomerase/epimerase family protein n=1 Tax=Ilumatobacter sp. TaxID=1967498 RepID=UPI003C40B979